jgi:hypothetical protein
LACTLEAFTPDVFSNFPVRRQAYLTAQRGRRIMKDCAVNAFSTLPEGFKGVVLREAARLRGW